MPKFAGVMKLADMTALEAVASNGMQVQVLSPAHIKNQRLHAGFLFGQRFLRHR